MVTGEKRKEKIMHLFKVIVVLAVALVQLNSVVCPDPAANAVVSLGGSVANLIGSLNSRNLARWATDLSDNKDNFWYDALKNKNSHYTPEYAAQLADRYREIESKQVSTTFAGLLEKIQTNMMQDGGKHFEKDVKELRKILDSNSELAMVVNGYKANGANPVENHYRLVKQKENANYDSQLAVNVANWVRGKSMIHPVYNFEEFVHENNPCKPLEDLLKTKLSAYEQYLRLAADPQYYILTPYFQIENVDMLAACDRLKSTEILKKAEDHYREKLGESSAVSSKSV